MTLTFDQKFELDVKNITASGGNEDMLRRIKTVAVSVYGQETLTELIDELTYFAGMVEKYDIGSDNRSMYQAFRTITRAEIDRRIALIS